MISLIQGYLNRLQSITSDRDWSDVEKLAVSLLEAVKSGHKVFLCGNGGSAGNAMHLANDFLYGIEPGGRSMQVEALPANSSVLTCLGNDIGYEHVFSHQLKVKARANDILIVLSGSGNSENIVKALQQANDSGMRSFAILGYQGGKAKELAQCPIHFAINDMQIAEDLQMIVGHMLMQYLHQKLKENNE